MDLPAFRVGSTVVAEERWHGLLWSAVPQIVVSSTPTQLVTYLPTGTVSVLASNRGMPGTEGLTRSERKHQALKTMTACAIENLESPDKLSLYRPGRWSRINLGWDRDTGAFLGWYVNFELPPQPTPSGLASKDLVFDVWVNPDHTWKWKDREDYQRAIDDGIVDSSTDLAIVHEGSRVLRELERRTGPFADSWTSFRADPSWPAPRLPATHSWGGDAWTIPPGRRVSGVRTATGLGRRGSTA